MLLGMNESTPKVDTIARVSAEGAVFVTVVDSGGSITTPVSAPLLEDADATGAGDSIPGLRRVHTFQGSGAVSASTGSAVIDVEGSNDGTAWDTIGTITLTLGTAVTSDSFTSDDRYAALRGNVTTLTGTDAVVSLTVSG